MTHVYSRHLFVLVFGINAFCYFSFSLEIIYVAFASMYNFLLAWSHHRLGCVLSLSPQLVEFRHDQSLCGRSPRRIQGARGAAGEVCEVGFLPLSQHRSCESAQCWGVAHCLCKQIIHWCCLISKGCCKLKTKTKQNNNNK